MKVVAAQWDIYPFVYCDSMVALEQAWAAGLPRSTPVKTFAPALAQNPAIQSIALGGEADVARLAAFSDLARDITEAMFAEAKALGFDHFLAINLARAALTFHKLATKALFVEASDLVEPRLTIGVTQQSERFNPLWPRFLRDNAQHQQWLVDWSPPPLTPLRQLRWVERLARLKWPILRYRLESWWRANWGKDPQRPVVLTMRIDDLCNEAVMAFSRSGYEIRAGKARLSADEALPEIRRLIERVIAPFARQWFVPGLGPVLAAMAEQILTQDLTQHLAARPAWRQTIKALPPGSLVLSSFPSIPEIAALAAVCRAEGMPFVSFQHAYNREIHRDHWLRSVIYENNNADLTIGYNNLSVAAMNASPFKAGRAAAFGFPPDRSQFVVKLPTRRRSDDRLNILYAYTGLASGNVTMLVGGVGDIAKFEREKKLVGHYFANSPHRITVKTYPGNPRYTEPDAIAEVARLAGVAVFDDALDMRFIMHEYDMIITARASSTLSHCLMSSAIIAFINYPDHESMRPDVFAIMAEGYFMFDYASPTFGQDFAAFLARDKSWIEQEWARKQPARQAFRDHFLGGYRHDIGDAIRDEVFAVWPQLKRAK